MYFLVKYAFFHEIVEEDSKPDSGFVYNIEDFYKSKNPKSKNPKIQHPKSKNPTAQIPNSIDFNIYLAYFNI